MSSLHGRLNTYASSFIFYTVSLFFFKCLAVLHQFLTKMMMRALMVMLSRLDEISSLFILYTNNRMFLNFNMNLQNFWRLYYVVLIVLALAVATTLLEIMGTQYLREPYYSFCHFKASSCFVQIQPRGTKVFPTAPNCQ